MALKVIIGDPPPKVPDVKIELQIRTTLAGDYIITDHPQLDILVSPSKNKITSFTKDKIDNSAYPSHDSLYRHLYKNGIIDYDIVIGGNIYGSYEAPILKSDKPMGVVMSLVLMNISTWIETDREKYDFIADFKDLENDEMVHPDKEDSTELGEIPQQPVKGSMARFPVKMYSPYTHYYE